jgi:hypothetical protein
VRVTDGALAREERRRGWLLRKLHEDLWLVHMEEVHPKRIGASRLSVDDAPRASLHPVDQFFDAIVVQLVEEELPVDDDALTIRAIECHTAPLKRVFVLDTSALRSASTTKLIELGKRVVLGFSSYSAWELLAHLETEFAMVRANLLKTRHLALLDDPHRMFLAGARLYEAKEIEDADTLSRLIPLLENSASWVDFQRQCVQVIDPALAGLGRAVRAVFDTGEEQRHVLHSRNGRSSSPTSASPTGERAC